MCNGFSLIKRDDYFWDPFEHFLKQTSIFEADGAVEKLDWAENLTSLAKFNQGELLQSPDKLCRIL